LDIPIRCLTIAGNELGKHEADRCFRLEKSRAQRIIWLLEELQLDYNIKYYKRDGVGFADPALKDVHPLGKSPVVEVKAPGVDKPIILAESGALIEYICDYWGEWLVPKRYPAGKENQLGEETEAWMRYRFFMHYAEGSLMPNLLVSLLMNGKTDKSPSSISNMY
jgi:glutathione S-transferase